MIKPNKEIEFCGPMILLPPKRYELKVIILDLSDSHLQLNEWTKNAQKYPDIFVQNLWFYALDTFDISINWYRYDEERLLAYCYTVEEAKKFYEFYRWIDELLEDIEGKAEENQPNDAYLKHPKWPELWQRAKEMYKIMDDNDKKYNFERNQEIFSSSKYFNKFDEWEKFVEEHNKHFDRSGNLKK